jgi:NTE family protein
VPEEGLGAAVSASCAIPGWFAPVRVDGRRHIDGGAHSTTNADVVADLGLDAVVVSAPMAGTWRSLRPNPTAVSRTSARLALAREVAAVRRQGTPVLVLQPDAGDTPMMDGRAMDLSVRGPVAEQARASALAALDAPGAGDAVEVLASS